MTLMTTLVIHIATARIKVIFIISGLHYIMTTDYYIDYHKNNNDYEINHGKAIKIEAAMKARCERNLQMSSSSSAR